MFELGEEIVVKQRKGEWKIPYMMVEVKQLNKEEVGQHNNPHDILRAWKCKKLHIEM